MLWSALGPPRAMRRACERSLGRGLVEVMGRDGALGVGVAAAGSSCRSGQERAVRRRDEAGADGGGRRRSGSELGSGVGRLCAWAVDGVWGVSAAVFGL